MEGPTLQEWGGRRAVMDALPAMDCYEDMFKEITRKLYGEDNLPDGETDHGSLRTADCDGDGPDGHGALAAFGLAALMQNGFPPPPGMFAHHHHLADAGKVRNGDDKWVVSEESLPWTSSKIASYNAAQRLFRCTECECVGFLSRVAEHWLGTHANLRVFQCPSCPYSSAWARCVRMHLQRQHNVADSAESLTGLWKENPVLEEVTKYLQRLKGRVESPPTPPTKTEYLPPAAPQHHSPPARQPVQPSGTENTPSKRYCCTFCPYATDRRDLFTRHENIHRDEKPFQCYVCQKQFNRADHVKKHFLRMHRDHPYDLNRIRRPVTKGSNGVTYYDKYSQQAPHRPQTLTPQGQIHHGLNIPAGFPPSPAAMRGLKQLGSPTKIINGCNAKSHGSKSGKKKGEKRYSCCYCTWSGVDNWCLKRHLNTHLKPFVCALCDYKAARSERLATHVLKVHNKRACGRCSFLAEDSAQLAIHVQEHHPMDSRSNHRAPPHVLRAANLPNSHATPHLSVPFSSHDGTVNMNARRHGEEPSGLWAPHSHIQTTHPLTDEGWRSGKHFGAARLFHYMEASDGSEPENEPEEEPPPFICRECGCEFVDDTSLETHVFTHHRSVRPTDKYAKCSIEEKVNDLMSKRCRKQGRPRRVAETVKGTAEEIRVVRRVRGRPRLRASLTMTRLREKYISEYVLRRRFRCNICRTPNNVFPYHTTSSLALHRIWRHHPERFRCEHCPARFRHQYQIVLHGSRQHLPKMNVTCCSPPPTLLDLQPVLNKSHFAFSTSRTLQELVNKPYGAEPHVHSTYKVVPIQGTSLGSAPMALMVPPFPQTA